MPPRKVREVAPGLLRKGFRRSNTGHTPYTLYVSNKKTIIWTKISHGEIELTKGLLVAMARQLRLKRAGFAILGRANMRRRS